MRSRYSAYVLKKIDYLVRTQCDSSNPHEIEAFAKAAYFQNLEIIEYGEDFVEFKAYYILDHHQELLHEKSFFICENEKWCYKNGKLFSTSLVFKRNETCICGSGKKYKKCCALL
jgi:SEC-C motif-containing protein